MQPIFLDDPAWQTTFPHRVTPLHEEWLAGLLLRCDEVNHWVSGTTWTYLRQESLPVKSPFLPYLSVPTHHQVEYIAKCLALPVQEVRNTTYLPELTRYYGLLHPLPGDLKPSLTFRVCPACLAEKRFLKRTLALLYVLYCPWHQVTLLSTCQCGTPLRLFDPVAMPFTCSACHICPSCLAEAQILRRIVTLPHITCCLQHHVALLERCQCGASLRLFHRQARPFACCTCGRDWAELPRVEVLSSQVEQEQKFLIWYEFFFSQGTSRMMRIAMQLVDKLPLNATLKRLPLGTLVILLVQHGRSPQDLLDLMERVSRYER